MQSYDFIGVTERFDESLVMLGLLLNLDLRDVAYLSSKRSGYALTGDSQGNLSCVLLYDRNQTSFSREYFSSETWKQKSLTDRRLYQAASTQLDTLIAIHGKTRFRKKLTSFQKIQKIIELHCEKFTRFPCMVDGTLNLEGSNCFTRDEGCGFDCIDAVLEALEMQFDFQSRTFMYDSKGLEPDVSIATASQTQDKVVPHTFGLTWLLSFPNSGTTYALKAVTRTTNTRVATNYATESKLEEPPSVLPKSPIPVWLKAWRKIPQNGTVLVKTHCEGYGFHDKTLISREQFIDNCAAAGGAEKLKYHPLVIQRAVHLIRDPFNNVVSRFRFERKYRMDNEERQHYPNDEVAFRNYCFAQQSAGFHFERQDRLLDSVESTDELIPCYMDFIRYVHWHNLAFEMEHLLKLEVLVLSFEDWETSWNQTMTALLDFVSLPVEKPLPTEFIGGKVYRHYFTQYETKAIESLVKRFASEKTWNHLAKYFEKDPSPIPRCTYSMIHSAHCFYQASNISLQRSHRDCFDVDDAIPKLPFHSVINRENMRFLGRGSTGIVSEGIISIPSSEGERFCSCAIKSDKCYKRGTRGARRELINCLHPDAILVPQGESRMVAEYLGALVFAESQKAGKNIDGMIPTWGVIDSPHTLNEPPSPVAVLMPLLDFVSLIEISEPGTDDRIPTSDEGIARWMLPAIEALSFLETLGLSHQDIKEKNIAVPSEPSPEAHALLYDNSYLSFVAGERCFLDQFGHKPCTFSSTKMLEPTHRPSFLTGEMIRRYVRTALCMCRFGSHLLPSHCFILYHRREIDNTLGLLLEIFKLNPEHQESSELSRKLYTLHYSGQNITMSDISRVLQDATPSYDRDIDLSEGQFFCKDAKTETPVVLNLSIKGSMTTGGTEWRTPKAKNRIAIAVTPSPTAPTAPAKSHDDDEQQSPSCSKNGAILPFIVYPTIDVDDDQNLLAEEAKEFEKKKVVNSYVYQLNDILNSIRQHNVLKIPFVSDAKVLKDGSVLCVSSGDSQSSLTISLKSPNKSAWVYHTVDLPILKVPFANLGYHVDAAGTITIVVDACQKEWLGSPKRCITILKTSPDENGYKPLSIIAENVIEIPDNCSLDEFDPHYACSCGIEEPTIWYDEPMEKVRDQNTALDDR